MNATAAPDGLVEEAVGLNHLAFDVTADCDDDLAAYLQELNARSEEQFRKSLRLALAPQQLLAGGAAYEYAFIADPDGVLFGSSGGATRSASGPRSRTGGNVVLLYSGVWGKTRTSPE